MSLELRHHVDVSITSRGLRRRDFLRGVSAAALAGGLVNWHDYVGLQAAELRKRGMSCILLWMQGGPSHFETFSPKPDHENGGETKAIATAVPGIQIAENLPQVAQQMQDIAIVRSMTSKEGAHPRATYLLHTGYLPTASIKYPEIGAVVSKYTKHQDLELPAFVRVGGARQLGGAGGGMLGVEHDPFVLAAAGRPPANGSLTTEVPRYERRLALLDELETDYAATSGKQEVADHRKLYQKAAKLVLSPQMKTFDLEQESASMRDAYGRSAFGSGCLLARRLVESGVPFVEVTMDGWDTHQDNFSRTKSLCSSIDQPMAQLIKDLKERGLLESTLVVWMGEFGRTPRVNPRGGRDHYPVAFNVAMAGGGVRGGQVIGRTDAAGAMVEDRPVSVPDLFQTFCHALSIDPKSENIASNGRPIKIVDGGAPVKELFG